MCSTLFRRRDSVHYCYQEKKTGALLFSGEGNWCTSVLRRRKQVFYSFNFLREGIWCYTVLRRKKLVLYCSQEKETGALRFSRRRKQVL